MSGTSEGWGRAATVAVTALLVSGAFVVFFGQASEAAEVTASSSSTVTQGDDLDVTVAIDLDSDERIPIQEVALKIQRADDAELLKDVRWKPSCNGGSFSLLSGYDEDVATTSGCNVTKGGSSSGNSSDVHGHGYLRGDDLGYGYTSGEGYGYFDSSREETRTDGYGYGYGYSDGSSSLEWTVTVDTSDLPATDVETVGVVDTGTTALGDFQSDQTANVVTVESGGGGGDGAAGEARDLAEKAASQCRPSCDLGDLARDATVEIDAGPDDPALVSLSFDVGRRLTDANLSLATHEPTDPPDGVDAPPAHLPANKLLTVEVRNGSADASDAVENLTIAWKLPEDWLSGGGADRGFAIPGDLATLGHFEDGQWVREGAQPADAPADGDETRWNYHRTELDGLSTFATAAGETDGPTFSNPRPDPATDDRRPTVGVDYSDAGVGVDADNVTIALDGTDVTDEATVTDTGVTYTPGTDLALGDRTVEVTASDHLGNEETETWTFEVVPPDDQAPNVLSVTPEDGATVGPETTIEATYDDAGAGVHVDAIVLTVDGTDVTGEATVGETSLSYAPEDGFAEGEHGVTLELADRVGNEETETWSFTVGEDGGISWPMTAGIVAVLGVVASAVGYVYTNPEVLDRFR